MASKATTTPLQNLAKVLLGMSRCFVPLLDGLLTLFREVHKAVHHLTGRLVALKRILMHNEKEGMPVTALREIKILKALDHPCIIEILDMFVVRSECLSSVSCVVTHIMRQVMARTRLSLFTWCFHTWTMTLLAYWKTSA